MRVVFTPSAETQLASLYDYIASRSGEEPAERYVARIVAFCENLTTFPFRGTTRDDLLRGLRTIGFERRVLIAFVVGAEALDIVGVFYGGRNFEAAFGD